MKRVATPEVFISHASEDTRLASALQNLLEATLRSRSQEQLVFRSTDVKAMEGGADWYADIIKAIRDSHVCLTLLTPISVHKSWVMYESGAAYAVYSGRRWLKKLIPVCASGITPGLVPKPLKRLQAYRLYHTGDLEQLLKQLAGITSRTYRRSTKKISVVAKLSKDLTGGWDSVQPSRVATRADLSPYRFDRVLAIAQDHVFVAGQNLYTIASSGEHRESILNFLSSRRGRRVDLLICDPTNSSAINAWAKVNPDQAETGYTYKNHLQTAKHEFAALVRQARKRKLNLNVKVLGLVSFGATAIDPDSDNGIISFQPVVNHGPKSGERPMFLLTKTGNPEIFRYYWSNLQTAYRCAKNLESVLRSRRAAG